MTLGRHLQGTAVYEVARETYTALMRQRAAEQSLERRVISLEPERRSGEHALLGLRLEPFLEFERGLSPNLTNGFMWRCWQMAMTLLDLGYGVDVIHQYNEAFVPRKPYSLVLDLRRVLQHVAPFLDRTCRRIAYLDTAHTLFHDAAEARRLLNLQRRRGVSLAPARFAMPNLKLEHADCGMTHGNEFTIETYRYARKHIYRMPVSAVTSPWPARKDFAASRRRFLFLASQGLVHKGLDLVLEAFASAPDLQLVVCAPVEAEPLFARAYHHELFETSNIEVIGWLDVGTDAFREVADGCAAMIMPSCSEAGAKSPVDGMHAGLLPIVTYETGVDVGDFGVTLQTDQIDDIKAAAYAMAQLPGSAIEARARAAWEYARAHHTRPLFTESFRETVQHIVRQPTDV